jgi:phage-related protein
MIKEKKNTITIIYSGVKKEIENVFSLVKSSINGVINIAKKCYDTFIKPWAEPIINFATNYMSFYSMINKGWKIIRNGWGCMKNTFKTGRNYILNKPYEKYWNKVKTYGSKSVNQIKYIYQKASQYYDKGRNLYKDFKIKILNYKNPIENNISDIINSLNK